MNKLHHFTNHGRSVVINTPFTPRAWKNYLWNSDGYLMSVSQQGDGESRYLTPKMELLNMSEKPGRYLYVRDDETNVSWNPGYSPLYTSLDKFECEHSLSYTEIRAEKDGIASSVLYFVPARGLKEVWKVTLKNLSSKVRKVSVFAAIEMDLAANFEQPRYYGTAGLSTFTYEEKINGIYCWTNNPYVPHDKFKSFLASSEKVSGYDCKGEVFLGGDSTVAHPRLLLDGGDCSNSNNVTANRLEVLQNKIVLQPGETKEILYTLGFCSSLDDAALAVAEVFAEGYLDQAMAETDAYWNKIIDSCQIETPDEKINNVMNIWAKKQMIFCGVGKKGVRDNMQIADGVLQIWPEGGRAEILDVLSHQFKDGHTVLTWFPYDDTYYSDQPIWLVMGIAGYIKETGDYGILDEIVPYQDEGSDTVLAHLKAGLKLKETDLGPNGLCKLRFADWNDALNVYTDDEAESIFVTMGLGYMLKEMAELTSRLGDKEFARDCMEKHAKLKQLVNEKAWCGEYYAMVLHKDGRIGAPESEGSTIYINPQTWAILGDMIPADRLPLVLKSMDEKIEHDFGLPVNWPPYEKHNFTIGRMGAFPYGIYENGGAYCHATGFGIVANAAIGRGETAVRLLKKIMPDHELNPSTQSGAEPFVFTNCYFTHPMRYGWSTASWMTGTSAWCFKGLVEGVLGVERGYDGLTLSPSLPANWKEGKVIRKYRGATYDIKIVNASGTGNGKPAIKVDGKTISGNVLPVFADGKTHAVEVMV